LLQVISGFVFLLVTWGHPAIFGKRISVELILDFILQGMTIEEISQDYDLPIEAVQEVMRFAQESVIARKVG
jgi:uncharacterized protein (DUF433 family)